MLCEKVVLRLIRNTKDYILDEIKLTLNNQATRPQHRCRDQIDFIAKLYNKKLKTATAGSDVVQSGRPIFDDFFQHLWPHIGNNTANVVFQMVRSLWLIRIDQ
ncbi:hypothetical protein TNCV_4469401 [Trichonephila clavipes]|nr:hypothetical protein TNCV_4469401 [Trichonephila clavipes]